MIMLLDPYRMIDRYNRTIFTGRAVSFCQDEDRSAIRELRFASWPMYSLVYSRLRSHP